MLASSQSQVLRACPHAGMEARAAHPHRHTHTCAHAPLLGDAGEAPADGGRERAGTICFSEGPRWGRGWPGEAGTPGNWGISGGRSAFSGCSLPAFPALGLPMWMSPAWQGRKGRQASGLVPLSDHTRMATTSPGAIWVLGSVRPKPEGPKPSLWGPSFLLGCPRPGLHQLTDRGGEPTEALPVGSGPAGLRPSPCLSGPWLHNPFVGQSLREGGAGGTEAPLSRPRTGVGAGVPDSRNPRESSHRGAAPGPAG